MSALASLIKREGRLKFRRRGEGASALLFILLVLSLFPFAFSPAPEVLREFAPGFFAIALLLGQMLQAARSYEDDLSSGALDTIALSNLPLPLYALITSIIRWLALILPLLVLSPIFFAFFSVEAKSICPLLTALLPASLCFALLNMAGAALAAGASQRNFLLPILLLPFYVPVLIFAVTAAGGGLEAAQALLFLGALSCFYLATLPFAAGAALKAAVEAA